MKTIIFTIILAGAAFGQCGRTTLNPFTGKLDCLGETRLPAATFADPPTSPTTGNVYWFTDASADGVCTGGGSGKAACRWNGSSWDAVGDSAGPVTITTGTGDPVAACTAPSATAMTLYVDTASTALWRCSDTNTWLKILDTNNTGPLTLSGLTGAAPGTPDTGYMTCWFDSTDKQFECKNDTGTITKLSTPSHVITAEFSGGGSALTNGTTAGVSLWYSPPLPFACAAVSWSIRVDQGTAGFRVWRTTSSTALPTVSDTITTADLAISSNTMLTSTTWTNWTGSAAPAFAIGDTIAVQLNAVSSATLATFSVRCQ